MEVTLLNPQQYHEGVSAYPGVLPLMTSSHWAGWNDAKDRAVLLQQIHMTKDYKY